MMRIAVLTPACLDYTGGIESLMRSWLIALDDYVRTRGGLVDAYVLLDAADSDPQRDLPLASLRRYRGYGGSRWRFATDVVRSGLREKYDLLICGHANLAPVARAVRWLTSGRTRYWIQLYGLELRYCSARIRLGAMAKADALVYISESTRQRAVAMHPCLAHVPRHICHPCVAPGHEPDAIDPADACEEAAEPTVLVVGRLSETQLKGQDRLIRALPRVRDRVPSARLVIVGDGPDRERLEGLAEEAGVADSVVFTGRVSDEELNEYYREAEVFALMNPDEGFGIVTVEAMSHGLPCVVARDGPGPEIIADGESGVLVDHSDMDAVAGAIADLLADQRKTAELGRRAQERVRTMFSQDAFNNRVAALLDQC